MIAYLRRSLHFYYAGVVIVLALLIGGGTAQGLWTDHLLELLMLPALFLGLGGLSSTRLVLAAKILVLLITALMLVQFLPISRTVLLGPNSPGGIQTALFSPVPQQSLEAALFATAVLGFFLYLARFSDEDLERCLSFVAVGVLVNFVVGVLQLSYGSRVAVSGALPFTITSGLFANENHLSSLIYASIPLLAYRCLGRKRHLGLYGVLAFLFVGFLFAVGSRAGMAIASSLSLLSLFWFLQKDLTQPRMAIAILLWLLSIVGIVLWLGYDSAIENDLRAVFFATTLRAIADHWLMGAGLGTFTMIYPAYEAPQNIVSVYANHAHNDFLELFLETGLPGLFLFVAFLLLVIGSFTRSRLSQAAFIALLALLLHSTVDYPLRTMALGVVFAYLCAVILSVRPFAIVQDEEEAVIVEEGEGFGRYRQPAFELARSASRRSHDVSGAAAALPVMSQRGAPLNCPSSEDLAQNGVRISGGSASSWG